MGHPVPELSRPPAGIAGIWGNGEEGEKMRETRNL
jgi:hypothetical protein